MALGDMSKALIIMSKARGWDPTVIQGGESIANFNKAPDRPNYSDSCVGSLPEGAPISYPEAEQPHYGSESVTWNAPNRATGSDANRRTGGSDPFAGQG